MSTLRARAAAAMAALSIGTAWSADVRADTPPSAWDIARDPAARDRWALHVHVQQIIHPAIGEEAPLPFVVERDEELRLEAARALLEAADAARGPDPRLRFDLGRIYEEIATEGRRADLHARVIDVLEPALRDAPDAPGSTDALEALVYAYAKLDRPRDELAAWRRYIPRLLDDRERIAPLMNMGEAEMRLGRLDDALATFHQTIAICESLPNTTGVNSTYALALWDLALALDRSGDPGTAIATAARAKGWTWSEVVGLGPAQALRTVTGWDVIRDQRNVFFVPEWDREWYLALGEASSARAAADPRDATRLWASAESHWDAYISRATHAGGHDTWLPIARMRREHAHAARAETAARAAKLPPRPSPKGEPWSDD